jgi:hypothetical protein
VTGAAARERAEQLGVRRLYAAHVGRPVIRLIDAGLRPPGGEWSGDARGYRLPVDGYN